MENQEPVPLKSKHKTLSDALDPEDLPTFSFPDRRLDASKEERTSQPDPLDGLPPNPLLEAVLIEQDVREFGHWVLEAN